jgi:alpha-amylase/alpha-mannosidase (GH57 family)
MNLETNAKTDAPVLYCTVHKVPDLYEVLQYNTATPSPDSVTTIVSSLAPLSWNNSRSHNRLEYSKASFVQQQPICWRKVSTLETELASGWPFALTL